MQVTRLTETTSAANCYLIEVGEYKVVVDCGLDLGELALGELSWGYPKTKVEEVVGLKGLVGVDKKAVFEKVGTEVDCFKLEPGQSGSSILFTSTIPEGVGNTTSLNPPSPSTGGSRNPAMFQTPLLSYLPSSELDVILITHPFQLLGLPYLTEYSDFKGQVIATEPTLQFGRQLMEELVTYFGPDSNINTLPTTSTFNTTLHDSSSLANLPDIELDVWSRFSQTCPRRPLYNSHEALSSLRRIRPVQFNEKTVLHPNLVVEPYCSGYSLGSANWLVGFISASSQFRQLHPLPLDDHLFDIANHLIFTEVPRPIKIGNILMKPISPEDNLTRISNEAIRTIKNGGNVLFPSHIQGVMFDLIETISKHLDTFSLPCPILVVSPVAEVALHYSNIAGEWMNSSRQQMMYLPEMPLVHGKLMANNKLVFFTDIHCKSFREKLTSPCIIFASHPSLRAGPVLHLIHLWQTNQKNLVIFTDPHYGGSRQLDGLVSEFQFQVQNMFLESRLLQSSVFNLIKKHNPSTAIIPHFFDNPDLIGCGTKMIHETFARGMDLNLNLNLESGTSSAVKAHITPGLARDISFHKRGRVDLAKVSAVLQVSDHRYVLDAAHKRVDSTLDYNLVSPQVLIQYLVNFGYDRIEISELTQTFNEFSLEINIPSLNASIQLNSYSIKICSENPVSRRSLTQLVRSIQPAGFDFLPLVPFPPPRKEIRIEEEVSEVQSKVTKHSSRPSNPISHPGPHPGPHSGPHLAPPVSLSNDFRPPPAYSNFRPPFRPNFQAVQHTTLDPGSVAPASSNDPFYNHHSSGRPTSIHYSTNFHRPSHKSNFPHRPQIIHRDPHSNNYSQRPQNEYPPGEYGSSSRQLSRHSDSHRPYRPHRPRPDSR